MPREPRFTPDEIKLGVQFIVTVFGLGVGSWILFGDYPAATEKAATGWIGLILGYWFR